MRDLKLYNPQPPFFFASIKPTLLISLLLENNLKLTITKQHLKQQKRAANDSQSFTINNF